MSKFKELYDFCQDLPVPPKVSRKSILAKTRALTEVQVRAVKDALDVTVCRGYFLSAANTEHKLYKLLGPNTIVLARDLNYCWQRLTYVKELMHLFDSEVEKTSSSQLFENLLAEFEVGQPSNTQSAQMASENRCVWMALACLCPERKRLELVEQFNRKHSDHYAIAVELSIPKLYVPTLLRPDFHEVVSSLW